MPYFANLMLIDAFVNLLVYMLCYARFRSAAIALLRDKWHMKFLPSSKMDNAVHPVNLPQLKAQNPADIKNNDDD